MKFYLLFSISLLSWSGLAQATYITGNTEDEDFVEYDCDDEKFQFWIAENEWAVELDACNDSNLDIKCLKIEISGVEPWAKDSRKEACIKRLDKYMKLLSLIAGCVSRYESITFMLSDGLFITKKEGAKNSKKYYKEPSHSKLVQLNTERFIERYKEKLDDYFNGKKIYVVNWGW